MVSMAENLLIELTNNCNMNCVYCYYYNEHSPAVNINLEKLEATVNEFIHRIKKIYITGGEPLLHPQFNEICRLLSGRGDLYLFSNGSLINHQCAQQLIQYFDKIFISVDSVYHEHEKSYRSLGLQTLNGIRNLLLEDASKVSLKICLTPQNVNEFFGIIEFYSGLGVVNFSVNLIVSEKCENILSDSYRDRLLGILGYLKSCNYGVYNGAYLDIMQGFIANQEIPKRQCPAGSDFLFIARDNRMLICPELMTKDIEANKSNNCFTENCLSLWELF